jgi:D-alanyl-D-alanine dipeptidase
LLITVPAIGRTTMTLPPGDPAFGAVPVRDCGELLVDVRATAPLQVAGEHPRFTLLRSSVVDLLVVAQSLLPRDVRLLVVDGYRPAAADRPTHAPASAGHLTGAAVDLTLCGQTGVPLPIDLASGGTCPTCAAYDEDLTARADAGPGGLHLDNHALLVDALTAMGFVNCPPRWWHWSYGDRHWAHATRAPHARYGPLPGS